MTSSTYRTISLIHWFVYVHSALSLGAHADCASETPAKKSLSYAMELFGYVGGSKTSDPSAQFKAEELSTCVTQLIRDHLTGHQIMTRLSEADILRTNYGTEILKTTDNSQDILHNAKIMAFVPFTAQDAYEVQALHSLPLLDFNKFGPTSGPIESHLNQLTDFYRSVHSDSSEDLTLAPNLLDRLQPTNNAGIKFPPSEEMAKDPAIWAIKKADLIVDPLVVNLLREVGKGSLTPWQLIKRSTEIYHGDVFTALGAIGYTMDVERIGVTHRDKRLFLGSRVQALFRDTKNGLGDNYHFWMYLNAALQGKSKSARWMSYTYQTFVGDPHEKRADALGIKVGEKIRSNLLSGGQGAPKCLLK